VHVRPPYPAPFAVLWGAGGYGNFQLFRKAPGQAPTRVANIPNFVYGLGLDQRGYVWTSSLQDCSVLRVNAAGSSLTRFDYSPYVSGYACYTSGLAVDQNNHLWITSRTDPGYVIRVNANYDHAPFVAVIWNAGLAPAGVSIDNMGKPWTTSISSHEAVRLNPVTNAVDTNEQGNPVRVYLGANASPYNYGDMTGATRPPPHPLSFDRMPSFDMMPSCIFPAHVPIPWWWPVLMLVWWILDPAVVRTCACAGCVAPPLALRRHGRHWLHDAPQGQLANDVQWGERQHQLGRNFVDRLRACCHRTDGPVSRGRQPGPAVRRL
jgi:hypothetical protein